MEIDRSTYIGGGDAAAILNLSPYRQAAEVWLAKTGQQGDTVDGPAIYWGNRMEALVAEEFTIRTGRKVRRRSQIIRHPHFDFLGGHVDRKIVGEDGGLEVKTTNVYTEVPDWVKVQTLHYLLVTGWSFFEFACLNLRERAYFGGRIDRDEVAINALLKAELRFWNEHVLTGVPPPIDYAREESRKVLDRIYSGSDDVVIDAPDELMDAIAAYAELSPQIKAAAAEERRLKKLRSEHENRIREAMGKARKMLSDAGTFTRTWIEAKEYTTKREGYARVSFKPSQQPTAEEDIDE